MHVWVRLDLHHLVQSLQTNSDKMSNYALFIFKLSVSSFSSQVLVLTPD